MRRARRVEITGCLLDLFLTAQPREDSARFCGITSDAPEDMHVTGIDGYDPVRDVWTFVVESAVFNEVPEGAIPTLFTPTFTAHYEGDEP